MGMGCKTPLGRWDDAGPSLAEPAAQLRCPGVTPVGRQPPAFQPPLILRLISSLILEQIALGGKGWQGERILNFPTPRPVFVKKAGCRRFARILNFYGFIAVNVKRNRTRGGPESITACWADHYTKIPGAAPVTGNQLPAPLYHLKTGSGAESKRKSPAQGEGCASPAPGSRLPAPAIKHSLFPNAV